MSRIRVGVLRGGPSDEYEVSLKTGAAVLNAIDQERFEPIDVVITKSGEWLVNGFERYPEKVLSQIDIAFLALHGTYGEDGTVQRLLDRHGIRYTGSRALPSSIAMNKCTTKSYLKGMGIKMAPHLTVSAHSHTNVHGIAKTVADMFGPQYVIKPVSKGSSVGVTLVKDPTRLGKALAEALEVHDEVMVEKLIVGKEATCGVIENYRNEQLYALPPVEIVPPKHADFFDYTVKYDGTTEELCPSRFTSSVKRDIELAAKKVHETIGLSQYSRSDFIVAEDAPGQEGGIYFLEVNTLPGLTEHSLLPRSIAAVGGTYTGLITHLLTDRLERR